MCGVQRTFQDNFEKKICLSTCPSDMEVIENVMLLLDARNHFTK